MKKLFTEMQRIDTSLRSINNGILELLVMQKRIIQLLGGTRVTVSNKRPRAEMPSVTAKRALQVAANNLKSENPAVNKTTLVDNVYMGEPIVGNIDAVIPNHKLSHDSSSLVDNEKVQSQSTGEDSQQSPKPNEATHEPGRAEAALSATNTPTPHEPQPSTSKQGAAA